MVKTQEDRTRRRLGKRGERLQAQHERKQQGSHHRHPVTDGPIPKKKSTKFQLALQRTRMHRTWPLIESLPACVPWLVRTLGFLPVDILTKLTPCQLVSPTRATWSMPIRFPTGRPLGVRFNVWHIVTLRLSLVTRLPTAAKDHQVMPGMHVINHSLSYAMHHRNDPISSYSSIRHKVARRRISSIHFCALLVLSIGTTGNFIL